MASCNMCTAADSEQMVQCDTCDQWTHFTCAGVSEDVAERNWSCSKCLNTSNSTENTIQAANMAGKQTENKVRSKSIDEKSTRSSVKSKRGMKLEMMLLEERKKAELAYLEEKFAIMRRYESADETDDEGIDEALVERRIREWANGEVQGDVGRNEERQGNMVTGQEDGARMQARTTSAVNVVGLRPEQINARHVVPKDLPVFGGKPEEWPLFLSSFENSTRLCGFSHDENLLRLQRALKGKALEYVSSKLMIPALVPEIIATLRMVFGKPEQIINSLLSKLRTSPPVNVNKLDTLVTFALEVKNLTATMQASGLQSHMNNPLLIQELIEKLPAQMRLQWALFSRSYQNATVNTFSEWLFDLAEAASSVASVTTTATVDTEKRKPQRVSFHTENIEAKGRSEGSAGKLACYFCKESHVIMKCDKFKNLEYNEKWNAVRDLKLCKVCLRKHDVKSCRERRECGVNNCNLRHNPLLHKSSEGNEDNVAAAVVATHHQETSNTLYRVAPITIYGNGVSLEVYAFLDDGSGPTLIEKSVLQQLQLQGKKKDLCLRWTDGTTRVEANSEVIDLEVSPRGKEQRLGLHNVHSVEALDLPQQTLNIEELTSKYKHLRGIPVESYYKIRPQVIIGLSNKHLAIPLKFREGKEHEPAATKTRIGWTVYGVVNHQQRKGEFKPQFHICECDDEVALQKLVMEGMYQEKEFYDHPHLYNRNEEPEMKQNITREDQHFVVKLLWKSETIVLPDNYMMAMRRLTCFEKKLKCDSALKARVNDQIKTMQVKGYIRKLDDGEIIEHHPRKWYLPIFVVRNPNKPDKIRLVWDAAAEYKGVSLNSCLDKGPGLLTPLFDILVNFRVWRYGICGDISDMFHRVFVSKEDQQAQRFLWRDCDDNRAPDVYSLLVLSFGASCSPSLAQFVKNQNALQFASEHPRAAKCILERHYVDDMLDGANTIQEAIELGKKVKEIHKNANFHIRGWLSNSKEVVDALGDAGAVGDFCNSAKRVEQVIDVNKVLGMWWHTEDDAFTYSLKFTKANDEILHGKRMPTKRELLRMLMSIFDPLGLLTFYLINMRILLQKVWRTGIGWDETIPTEFHEEWMQFLSSLSGVQTMKIPRCYFDEVNAERTATELHVFVDAGENAYAAVAYLRLEDEGKIEVSLVSSKSKVAPLRPVSIPRMELLAAVMGARLGNALKKALDLRIDHVYYWADSKTVLCWIRSDPRKYKQFVMFRVGEIQETTEISQWRYVPTKLNVADLATKYNAAPDFSSNSRWITGPAYLRQPKENWPSAQAVLEDNYQQELQLVAVNIQDKDPIIDVSRFSKWEKIERVMAYVKRFITKLRGAPIKGNLTTEELAWSRNYLHRLAQAQAFSYEIKLLTKDCLSPLPKTSQLRKLSPFIDETGTLRMRSRLEKASCIDDATKNPIILPKISDLTNLIVDWYHRKWKHVNHETVINEIFQIFYIPGLRSLLRSVRFKCQTCKNQTASPRPPQMADLPEARLSAFTRPFTNVGVDFFGPFLVTVGRRTEKRYGVLFTCLTCRAVHIEMAYSLTTNSCCIVVRNFIARRGSPRAFFSDNGTNLKATEKELRNALAQVKFEEVTTEFTSCTTTWTFIPPASPHMGGAWERLIRSIKNVLYHIVTPETKLTDEKLSNLLIEVEQIVNSRPLTYLSLDTAEQEVLTPNHFLLGSSSGLKPVGEFNPTDQYVRASWRHSQYLAEQFWKRWVAEVLPTLTRRTTWYEKENPIKIGDVVVIVDPKLPRYTWPKGVVVSTVPAKDGQVRSAIIKTSQGQYHRPATKIAVLDVRSGGFQER